MNNLERNSPSTSYGFVLIKLYEKLITELRCPGCSTPMRRPIFLCKTGHSNCENCTKILNSCPLCEEEFTTNRNLTLEAVCSKAEFPCENSMNGCKFRCTTALLDWHEKRCSYRIVKCFIGKVWGKCEWKGFEKNWLEHINKNHLDKVFVFNPTDLTCHIKSDLKPLTAYYIFQMYNQVFSFYQIYDKINRKVLWTMSYEPKDKDSTKATKFAFEIEIYDIRDPFKAIYQRYECHYNGDKDILRDGACAMMSIEDISRFLDETKILHYRVRIHKVNNVQDKGVIIKEEKKFPINYQQISIEGVNQKHVSTSKIITRQIEQSSLNSKDNCNSCESITKLSSSESDSESDIELQEFVNNLFRRQQLMNSNNSMSKFKNFDTINSVNSRKQTLLQNISKSYKNMKTNLTALKTLRRKRSHDKLQTNLQQ